MRQKINPNCWTGRTCLTQIRRPSQIFKISAGRSLSASAFIGVFQTCFLPTRIFTFLLLLNFQAVHQSPGRKGGICMQNFLYFLCRYGNVSQVPESQDRLAGFRIFPQFEANSWGQDKWSGLYLPARIIVWNHHNYHHCKCRLRRIFYFFQLKKFTQPNIDGMSMFFLFLVRTWSDVATVCLIQIRCCTATVACSPGVSLHELLRLTWYLKTWIRCCSSLHGVSLIQMSWRKNACNCFFSRDLKYCDCATALLPHN